MDHRKSATRRRPFAVPAWLPVSTVVTSLLAMSPVLQAEEEKTLSAVTVTATGDQPDSYRASKTRVGKVVQDPHDVPQAITTVTRALIEEQEANSLREALRNVSGLTYNAAEGGRAGDNMMLRGFYTFGDMYLDGMRDTAQYNREVFNLEQVDVLRGSAAMLFGRGQAGGVINQVSKTPMLYGINKVGFGVGTQGFLETKADLNQRLGETTALRINLMHRDEESSRSNPYTGTKPQINRTGVAPSIAFGLGTPHEVVLSHLWTKTEDRPDYGVRFVNRVPDAAQAKAGNYYGVDGNFDNSETNITTLSYLYKMAPDTQWRTVLRSANYQRAYWAVAAQGVLTPLSTQTQAKTRQFDINNWVLQSDFNTAFNLLGMRHELVTGAEFLREDAIRWTLRNLGTATAPRYEAGQFSTAPAATYQGDTYSLYVQDSVEFVRDWKLTAGIRRDEMRADIGTATGQLKGDFSEDSYRLGLSWQPSAAQHYYLGWSDSFSPTADLYQLTGNIFPAERSQVTELGAKWLLLDGDLALRTALYRADKDWERSTDLDVSANNALLTKRRRSDGMELELAGRLTERWEVFGGASLINAHILELSPLATSSAALYQNPRNTPKHTLNLWTTYRLPAGFKIGGGAEYKSKRAGYNPASGAYNPNFIPAYWRWDAMLAYEDTSYAIKFNIQNLFNKTYYDSLYDNGGFTIPGQSRRFLMTAELKF